MLEKGVDGCLEVCRLRESLLKGFFLKEKKYIFLLIIFGWVDFVISETWEQLCHWEIHHKSVCFV